MSIRTSAIVWEQSTAEGTELLLMLAIADNANDNGEAYPSVPKLARRCRIKTDRGIQKVIAKRVEAGELVVDPRFYEDANGVRRQTSNLYTLIFRGLENSYAQKKYPPVPQDTPRPSGGTPPARPVGHPPGEQARTGKRSNEPSSKSSFEQGSDSATAANKFVAEFIDAWVKGWIGKPSGKPFQNKTYRDDALGAMDLFTLVDVQRYTQDKAGQKQWKTRRPAWSTWFNDMGSWLKENPDPNGNSGNTGNSPTPEQIEQTRQIRERLKGNQNNE